jgi:hypothetical protein
VLYVVKCPFQHAITFTYGRGGIEIQRRAELFGELVDGETIAVQLVVFVCESGRARKHEQYLVFGI